MRFVKFIVGFSIPTILFLIAFKEDLPTVYYYCWGIASERTGAWGSAAIYYLTHYYQNISKLTLFIHVIAFSILFAKLETQKSGVVAFSFILYVFANMGHGFNHFHVNSAIAVPVVVSLCLDL